jgi:hypothetical protein
MLRLVYLYFLMELYCFEESDDKRVALNELQKVTDLLLPLSTLLLNIDEWSPKNIKECLRRHHFGVAARWYECLEFMSKQRSRYWRSEECVHDQLIVARRISVWNEEFFGFFFGLKNE